MASITRQANEFGPPTASSTSEFDRQATRMPTTMLS
jgi:hypothetical protein